MASLPKHVRLQAYSHSDAQNMLNEAQADTATIYAGIPYLRDQLQQLFQDALDQSNNLEADPMEILHRAMFTERIVLDAYNKHRLGNAVTPFNARILDPGNAVEYRADENIPEVLAWFPLRDAVSSRGVHVQAPPIYQLGQDAGTQQQQATASFGASSQANGTGQTPTSGSAVTRKKSTGSGAANYNKLRDAPSPWLSFPAGNLTMAEVAAFVPQSIKSFDIIDRFIHNGALSATLAGMINQYRAMPGGPIETNTIYRMMKGPMDARARTEPEYQRWTVTKHANITKPAGFDPTSVSVANFRTPLRLHPQDAASAAHQPPPTILFRDMANGVATMPSGYDALDLTRCIEYCVANAHEDWYYPQDFARLVNHLGGPAPVHREHQDAAAVARQTSAQKLSQSRRVAARERDSRGRLTKQRRASMDVEGEAEDVENEAEVVQGESNNDGELRRAEAQDDVVPTKGKKRKDTTALHYGADGQSPDSSLRAPKRHQKHAVWRIGKAAFSQNIDSDSDSDAYVGPKNRKKNGVATRRSARGHRFSGSYNIDEALGFEDEDVDREQPAEEAEAAEEDEDAMQF